MPFPRRIDRSERFACLLLAVCFTLTAIDSGRVPYSSPSTWLMFYIPAIVAAVWYALTPRLAALQAFTVFAGLPGLARAFLYAIGPEHRIAPIGINGAIAVLMWLYHHTRRLDAL